MAKVNSTEFQGSFATQILVSTNENQCSYLSVLFPTQTLAVAQIVTERGVDKCIFTGSPTPNPTDFPSILPTSKETSFLKVDSA